MWLFELLCPQFCKFDMSRYGYLEVFQRVPWNSRQRESTVSSNTCAQQWLKSACDPKWARWRFRSDCTNALSDLNLRLTLMFKGTFSDNVVQLMTMIVRWYYWASIILPVTAVSVEKPLETAENPSPFLIRLQACMLCSDEGSQQMTC